MEGVLGGLLFIGVGALLLYFGADLLIRGASGLARVFGVAPAVIGLTVVAFGTSLPELVVSVTAAAGGNPDIAIGNVVGSNIANIGLILGIAALIRPLGVEFTLLRREAPMGLGAAALVVLLSADGSIGRFDGCVLLVAFGVFLAWSVGRERSAPASVQQEYDKPRGTGAPRRDVLAAVGGLVGVIIGGRVLVDGAVTVAEAMAIPAVVIGLTIVAVGSSLPELAASVVAASRGEDDISVGNVLGSNLFNLLLILGVAALVHPIAVPATFFRFQYPVLGAFSLAVLPICWTGCRISRQEGGVLLVCYVAYVAALYSLPGSG